MTPARTLTVAYGIDTTGDLEGLLPTVLRGAIAPELLAESPSAAALRILATLRDERWTRFVYYSRIDWTALLAWACDASDSVHLRAEIAASLAGCPAARPDLLAAAYDLGEEFAALMLDALRIAREGLSS